MSVGAIEVREAPLEAASGGLWSEAWLRLRTNPGAIVGFVIICVLVIVALFAPLIAPFDPNQRLRDGLGDLGQPLPAGGKFLLGTDGLGRDLLSRLIWGGQVSLLIGVSATFFAVLLGLILGATAGYMQGAIGQVVMRLVDVLMAFPPLLLAIALAALLRPSVGVVIAVIALTYWIYLAHLPLVVALQIALAGRSLPWWVQMPLIHLAAFAILLAIYHAWVRFSWVGWWLNGRRPERARPVEVQATA